MNMNINEETPHIPFPLRSELLVDPAPSADLWSRIEGAHRVRRVRQRNRRIGGVVMACLLGGALAIGVSQFRAIPREAVDWQARAEALELQLHALQRDSQVLTGSANELESELGDIDRSLQTAYESGAPASDLAPLWKRRSELLDTLIVARKQHLLLTRI
jgi:hypothetical protein